MGLVAGPDPAVSDHVALFERLAGDAHWVAAG